MLLQSNKVKWLTDLCNNIEILHNNSSSTNKNAYTNSYTYIILNHENKQNRIHLKEVLIASLKP